MFVSVKTLVLGCIGGHVTWSPWSAGLPLAIMDIFVLFVKNFYWLTKDGTAIHIHELGAQYHGSEQIVYHKKWVAVQGVVESDAYSDNVSNINGVSVSVFEVRRRL